jgi:Rha family phage regulatory protein
MDNLVKNISGKLTVSSKQIADHFSVAGGHRYILSVIRKLINELGDFGVKNYSLSSYISKQNKKLPCYEITRDGFTFLAMGLTGPKANQWKIKYIEAFNAMEKMLSGENSVMQQLNQAIKLMEDDKQIASSCGKGLGEWKKARAEHIKEIEDLNKRAQLLLNF